ncbi:AcrR family transcriptional regulator [Rhodococcus sp. 27YEA15]|uniref:TetR/AcrR family transcriptional regulator n=1 Tax=Rhodococcus sp. 27YEA15 TaxID=3156259 RepID=UPI003C7A7310
MESTNEVVRYYGGKPVASRRAERRSLFMDAALDVFTGRSYARSSVADVCSAAGLARRQFYEEFSSREDLLIALYDGIQSEARAAMSAALTRETSGELRALVKAAITAFVESIGQDPRRAQIVFVDIVGVSPRVEEHRIEQRSIWVEFFEATVRGSVGIDFVPPGGYALASTAFIGALTALIQQWSIADPRPPVADLADLMTTLLEALIRDSSVAPSATPAAPHQS